MICSIGCEFTCHTACIEVRAAWCAYAIYLQKLSELLLPCGDLLLAWPGTLLFDFCTMHGHLPGPSSNAMGPYLMHGGA